MQNYLEKAMEIAIQAHKGQKDKGGAPYILHVIRVMMNLETMEEKIVALLHDVIENSEINVDDLKKEKFSTRIVAAVSLLTKPEEQQYEDYILNIKNNNLAKNVKLSDLKDNMNVGRLKKVSSIDKKRVEKYKKAYTLLTS